MLFSDSLIRRYTPPTCTLEIWARRSPLSRWRDRPVLKNLRFELRFDDPRTPEAEQVTVRGNERDLELLCDVVTTYVQNFLHPTPSYFSVNFGLSDSLQTVTETSRFNAVAQLERIDHKSDSKTPPPVDDHSSSNIAVLDTPPSIHLQGLLTHELYFGSLTTDSSQPILPLSASQLFDLANALEEYSNEASVLPTFQHSQPRKTNLIWTSSAAAFLLAMGITVGARVFYSSQQMVDSVASRKSTESQFDRSPLVNVLPPVPPAPLGKPVPSPTLPPSLTKQGILPPPSGVQGATSPPRNADGSIIIPPTTILLPRPVVPPAPSKTIAIAPQPPGNLSSPNLFTLPPSQGTRRIDSASSLSSRSTPPKLNLPSFPPLRPQPSTGDSSIPQSLSSETARLSAPKPTNNLLDTIPQVAEARQYFQQRWQVPPGLAQSLEYRLIVQQDGSLKRIIPLGKAASLYLDSTPMPLLGESFVSPLQISGDQTLRLVLEPKGNVRTFLE